jgi:hypothetical protein
VAARSQRSEVVAGRAARWPARTCGVRVSRLSMRGARDWPRWRACSAAAAYRTQPQRRWRRASWTHSTAIRHAVRPVREAAHAARSRRNWPPAPSPIAALRRDSGRPRACPCPPHRARLRLLRESAPLRLARLKEEGTSVCPPQAPLALLAGKHLKPHHTSLSALRHRQHQPSQRISLHTTTALRTRPANAPPHPAGAHHGSPHHPRPSPAVQHACAKGPSAASADGLLARSAHSLTPWDSAASHYTLRPISCDCHARRMPRRPQHHAARIAAQPAASPRASCACLPTRSTCEAPGALRTTTAEEHPAHHSAKTASLAPLRRPGALVRTAPWHCTRATRTERTRATGHPLCSSLEDALC